MTLSLEQAELTLSPDAALDLYRTVRLIRRFEETVQTLFLRGEVHGTTHLYIGQEAVATGVGSALGPLDRVAATYRGHGHALSIGVDPQALLDEMLGRATGVCGGRAGSMNVIDLAHGLIGSFGIIGGSMAAATGAALALRRTGGVAVAYFGDGATNHGYFHECMNFAAVNRLPVVFVCENNLYGEFTPWEDVTAGEIIDRPRVYGITASQVDGMDVFAVRAAADAAVARGPGGRRAGVPRGADVPLRRPLAQRPGRVSQAGRARRVARARSAEAGRGGRRRALRCVAGRRRRGRRGGRRAHGGDLGARARRARTRSRPARYSEFRP